MPAPESCLEKRRVHAAATSLSVSETRAILDARGCATLSKNPRCRMGKTMADLQADNADRTPRPAGT